MELLASTLTSRRSALKAAAATGAFALTHSGLASAAQDGGGATLTGAFDIGPGGSPQGFNPLTQGAGYHWLEKYYSKLFLFTPDFSELVPELAETWEVSEDAQSVTVTLREGLLWHDGEPLTSEDVKFSIDLYLNPDSASPAHSRIATIEAVEIVDDLTVSIALGKANAAILNGLSYVFIVPKHALESIAAADLVQNEWWRTSPVGSGPFMWSKLVPDQYLELVRNENYWRGVPKLERLINRYFPEAGTALIALQSGEIDFINYITLDERELLGGDETLSIIAGPSGVANFLLFNLSDSRFQDLRVRQAFMYGINRQQIVDELLQGEATVINSVFERPEYLPDTLNDYAYDPDRARELLAEASWDEIKGDPIEIITYYQDQLSNDLLVYIQQQLAEIGVDVTIRVLDPLAFREEANTPNYGSQYSGGSNGSDPDVTATLFVSDMVPPSGVNRGFFNNAELDALYQEGRETVGADERAQIYQGISQILNDELPWVFLWVTKRFAVVRDNVSDLVYTPVYGGGRFYDQSELWDVTEA